MNKTDFKKGVPACHANRHAVAIERRRIALPALWPVRHSFMRRLEALAKEWRRRMGLE